MVLITVYMKLFSLKGKSQGIEVTSVCEGCCFWRRTFSSFMGAVKYKLSIWIRDYADTYNRECEDECLTRKLGVKLLGALSIFFLIRNSIEQFLALRDSEAKTRGMCLQSNWNL